MTISKEQAAAAAAEAARQIGAEDMSETKHTPGPWKAGEAAWYRGRAKDDIESGKRPITATGRPVIANAYGRANAHLIAAAPDLLEALKAVVERIEEGGAVKREGVTGAAYNVWMANFGEDWCDVFNAAERAIAKAEGRS